MNFFSNTEQNQYAFFYQNQKFKDYKRKNFNCVFDSKVIIDFFSKFVFKSRPKKNSISEKKKKSFQSQKTAFK